MLFKIILIFLLAIVAIAMLGSTVVKLLRGPDPAPRVASAAKCAHCGRPVRGTAPCVCGKG
jgi:predicted permease